MLELDIIGAWDARAVNLDQEEADRNVYEFDLTLWNLLSTLAKERPDDAASQFSLGMDTVQKLSLATPSQLEALASGVLISFKLETAEQNIITRLSGDYDPVVFINHSVDEFDAAYLPTGCYLTASHRETRRWQRKFSGFRESLRSWWLRQQTASCATCLEQRLRILRFVLLRASLKKFSMTAGKS
ncbi:TPA: hypothetical protein ACPETL_003677 [Escherichia coli]